MGRAYRFGFLIQYQTTHLKQKESLWEIECKITGKYTEKETKYRRKKNSNKMLVGGAFTCAARQPNREQIENIEFQFAFILPGLILDYCCNLCGGFK